MALAFTLPALIVSPEEDPRRAWVGERELIGRSQAGDVEAFNRLVEHFQQRVYAVCVRMLGPTDADDATQEVFLAAFHSIRHYRGGSFLAWLLRIAKNQCIDQLRRRKRTWHRSLDADAAAIDPVPLQVPDPGEAPEDRVLRAELAQELQQRLAELEAEQRLVVILSDIEGYRYDEIVAATGWPLGTVKSRLSRGRARLRGVVRAGSLRPVL
ncbi:MAG TPA: sigma-70 family RNA polymerase sigma factor [Herpetosiphonaceae bacterium]|nr:sigma-70 family RNA polymerase sigma factor [Herpetosiphonaceae bacterium]